MENLGLLFKCKYVITGYLFNLLQLQITICSLTTAPPPPHTHTTCIWCNRCKRQKIMQSWRTTKIYTGVVGAPALTKS